MKKEYALLLSIIVPVYNVEKTLERCVKSLQNQDLQKSKYEILLINDGSSDNSYEIAKKIENESENVILVSQENRGQSVARNLGINMAKGKFIMFVDSDDYIEPNVLDKLIETAETNCLDLLFFHHVFEYVDGSVVEGRKCGFDYDVVYNGEYIVLNNYEISVIWKTIYLTEFLHKTNVRFYEGIIHQDVEFDYKLYPFAKRVMFTNIKVYHYCVYGESCTRTNTPEKIRRIIESDFHVARSLRICSADINYSEKIRIRYARLCNSVTVAALMQLARDHRINIELKKACLKTAQTLGVYPICGRTMSWYTTALSYLINWEWMYKKFL